MLAGIGGKTIEEFKRNVSHEEFQTWCLYRNKRGPMNPLMRMDSGFALVVSALTGKPQKTFMPYINDEEENIYDEEKLKGNINDENRLSVVEVDSILKSSKIIKPGQKIGKPKQRENKVQGRVKKELEQINKIIETSKLVPNIPELDDINTILKGSKVVEPKQKIKVKNVKKGRTSKH